MSTNLEKAKKLLDFKASPELANFKELQAIGESLKTLSDKEIKLPIPEQIKVEIAGAELVTIKGEKGEQGKQGEIGPVGEKGEKGQDSHVPGPRGPRGAKGEPGKDGRDGLDGKDGLPGEIGLSGKDGSPDTPEQIKDKLEILKDDERLDISSIKNVEKVIPKTGGVVARNLYQMGDANITEPKTNEILQYSSGLWKNTLAITVSATEPSSPSESDLWIDIS